MQSKEIASKYALLRDIIHFQNTSSSTNDGLPIGNGTIQQLPFHNIKTRLKVVPPAFLELVILKQPLLKQKLIYVQATLK